MRLGDGRIYLDCNATTPLDPEVAAELARAGAASFGNPSSPYGEGRVARETLERGRSEVAGLVGCMPGEIVFTGSATEANHLALRSAATARPGRRRVLLTAIEHPSVWEQRGPLEALGCAVEEIPVTREGAVDPAALESMLGPDVAVVSVMTAHNETGVLQPVAEVGRLCERHGAYFHTDAVQAVGKTGSPWASACPHYLAAAAHKLYGPKGIGALAARSSSPLEPMLRGGGQERGLRASTEAVPLAAAFGAASRRAMEAMEAVARLGALRDRMERELVARFGAVVHGGGASRLPNTSFFSLPSVQGAAVAQALDEAGIAVGTGSACHGAGLGLPRVLHKMGVNPALGAGTLRVSLGRASSDGDVNAFLGALPGALGRARN